MGIRYYFRQASSVVWNALLGGTVNTANTASSNVLYGDSNSLATAFGWGALGGGLGTEAGILTESGLSSFSPKYIGASPIAPEIPLLLQNFGRLNPYPGSIGEAANQTVSGLTPPMVDKLTNDNGSKP